MMDTDKSSVNIKIDKDAKPKVNLLIIGLAIFIVLVILVVGIWYWFGDKQFFSQTQEAPTLGGEIFEKTQNPIGGKLPDTNPFKNQKNPLDSLYKNPFE